MANMIVYVLTLHLEFLYFVAPSGDRKTFAHPSSRRNIEPGLARLIFTDTAPMDQKMARVNEVRMLKDFRIGATLTWP